ncbi:MAG: hypothetical protein IJP68_05815 [Selenomonadaceae bacterium]|nr:hypothetical protein [Selenomonadaceae bacterium]
MNKVDNLSIMKAGAEYREMTKAEAAYRESKNFYVRDGSLIVSLDGLKELNEKARRFCEELIEEERARRWEKFQAAAQAYAKAATE